MFLGAKYFKDVFFQIEEAKYLVITLFIVFMNHAGAIMFQTSNYGYN